jgi:hypothetical protein
MRMADDYGCVSVLVDAKPDAVDFYAKYGFIPVDLIEGQSEPRRVHGRGGPGRSRRRRRPRLTSLETTTILGF